MQLLDEKLYKFQKYYNTSQVSLELELIDVFQLLYKAIQFHNLPIPGEWGKFSQKLEHRVLEEQQLFNRLIANEEFINATSINFMDLIYNLRDEILSTFFFQPNAIYFLQEFSGGILNEKTKFANELQEITLYLSKDIPSVADIARLNNENKISQLQEEFKQNLVVFLLSNKSMTLRDELKNASRKLEAQIDQANHKLKTHFEAHIIETNEHLNNVKKKADDDKSVISGQATLINENLTKRIDEIQKIVTILSDKVEILSKDNANLKISHDIVIAENETLKHTIKEFQCNIKDLTQQLNVKITAYNNKIDLLESEAQRKNQKIEILESSIIKLDTAFKEQQNVRFGYYKHVFGQDFIKDMKLVESQLNYTTQINTLKLDLKSNSQANYFNLKYLASIMTSYIMNVPNVVLDLRGNTINSNQMQILQSLTTNNSSCRILLDHIKYTCTGDTTKDVRLIALLQCFLQNHNSIQQFHLNLNRFDSTGVELVDLPYDKAKLKEIIRMVGSFAGKIDQLTFDYTNEQLDRSEANYLLQLQQLYPKHTYLYFDSEIRIHLKKKNINFNKLNATIAQLSPNDRIFLHFSANECGFGNMEASQIANSLAQIKSISKLRLSLGQNDIQKEGAIEIANALQSLNSLSNLYFSLQSNNIGRDGANQIAKALRSLTKISSLQLGLWQSQIENAGVVEIAESLKMLPNISNLVLQLGGTNMEDTGAYAIANTLSTLRNLPVFTLNLYINHNKIGDNGATKIANALKYLQNISHLYLSIPKNNIGDVGAIEIASALKSLKEIKYLQLEIQNNNLTQIAKFCFEELQNKWMGQIKF